MFKEIVSQLAFSPATVGRLSEYAKKVKQKQRISGWVTFLFALLLLIHIVFPLFGASPAATPTQNDLVAGGVATTKIQMDSATRFHYYQSKNLTFSNYPKPAMRSHNSTMSLDSFLTALPTSGVIQCLESLTPSTFDRPKQ
jgi:hypothetical protein